MDPTATYSLANIKILHCPGSRAGEWQVWCNGERLEGYGTAVEAWSYVTGWKICLDGSSDAAVMTNIAMLGYRACQSRLYPQNTDSGQGGTVDGEYHD